MEDFNLTWKIPRDSYNHYDKARFLISTNFFCKKPNNNFNK